MFAAMLWRSMPAFAVAIFTDFATSFYLAVDNATLPNRLAQLFRMFSVAIPWVLPGSANGH
jgi:hypothetical protein